MAIADLLDLIPPPEAPLDADGDWGLSESEFGIRYPTDFRELIAHYGTGIFELHGLWIANPLTDSGRQKIRDLLWTYREIRDACEISLIIHPEKPGLFPWGMDHDGHGYCWFTDGDPDQWPIVQLFHGDEENPSRADANITTFLAKFARNEYPEMLGGIPHNESNLRFSRGLPWES